MFFNHPLYSYSKGRKAERGEGPRVSGRARRSSSAHAPAPTLAASLAEFPRNATSLLGATSKENAAWKKGGHSELEPRVTGLVNRGRSVDGGDHRPGGLHSTGPL